MKIGFSEQAVLLGPSKSLVGIVARPDVDTARRPPAVVILNTGIIHRVGHHRMYVDMARQLAAAGHIVLRFDFSGIGDSNSRADGIAPLASCLSDIREAVGWLEQSCGMNEVVLLGLCSGADHALSYGHGDPRVVGLVLLDPSIPPTSRYYLHYIAERLTRLRSWLSFGRGRGRIWQDMIAWMTFAISPGRAARNPSLINPVTRADLERVYQQSVDSGVRLLAVLTGGRLASRQTYREQLIDAFPNVRFNDRLKLEFFADCDHTFASVSDRKRLNALVLEWFATTAFGRAPASAQSERCTATGVDVKSLS